MRRHPMEHICKCGREFECDGTPCSRRCFVCILSPNGGWGKFDDRDERGGEDD